MIETTDQLGNVLHLPGVPGRIVSLVPSQTELLFDLGVGASVVGVTRYCTHPPDAVAGVARIGGTKRFHFERIESLRPDLVIGNKEENYPEGITRLQESFPVWMSDIADLADALAMIRELGRIVGAARAAARLQDAIASGFAQLRPARLRSAVYLVWREPWMVAAAGTFIDAMMARGGFRNVFGGRSRYPEVSLREIVELRPDCVLLSSEPYPFGDEHVAEFRERLPGACILLVDGTRFSWYGSRLLRTPGYLAELSAAG